MKAVEISRKAIKGVNNIVNFTVLTIILLLLAFAGYALWDSNQIYQAADKSRYAVYKPTIADEGKSFKELQTLNTEVIAWLSVYGTNIDYPVTQGKDNAKYVNTNVEGLYSLSGSLFLNYSSSKDFSDFSNILYGHHMEKNTMFGEIGNFSDKTMFDSHQYGNLYFNEKNHGIEFFAFVHTDAYDKMVFTPNVGEEQQQEFLDYLIKKAKYKRDIGITTEDRIILLSTCSSSSTNGRDILIGKINDEVYDDPFSKIKTNDKKEQVYVDSKVSSLENVPYRMLLPPLFILIILVFIIKHNYKAKQNKVNYRSEDKS